MRVGNPTSLDRFAELLSQDLPLSAIAMEMNLPGIQTANTMLQRLRNDLGWQAR